MTGWWANTQFRGGIAGFGVVTLGTAALLAVAAVVSPSDFPSWRVVVFAPLALFVVLVALLILFLRPWRYSADMTAMRAGHAWVQWTYDEVNWRAANRYDGERNGLWVRGALVALAAGVFLTLMALSGDREAAIGGGAFGGMLVFLALTLLAALMAGEPVRVARRAARGEIYVSRHGIYRRPGGYTPLDLSTNIKYESADLVDRPTPHVHIEVSVRVNPTGYGGDWVRKTLTDVGVPPGHEDEARALVELLRREVLNGSGR
jgi:hypothetical protein